MIKAYDPKTSPIAKAIPFPKYFIDSQATKDKRDPPPPEKPYEWKPINVLGDTDDEIKDNVYYTRNEGRVISTRKRHAAFRETSGSD